jgi:serine/threonine protein kinase
LHQALKLKIDLVALQCSEWLWSESSGKGCNSSVCCVINPVTSSFLMSGAQTQLGNEGQLLHELNHANIIQAYGIFCDDTRPGMCYLALEQLKCSL